MSAEQESLTDANSIEDSRLQTQDRISELLAELSEAPEVPLGIETSAQFTKADADFGSGAWMSRLAEVQGWLNLDSELDETNPVIFLNGLVRSLGIENPADEIKQSSEGYILTENALELLSNRLEISARLCQSFIAAVDDAGGNKTSATAAWSQDWASADDEATEDVVAEPVSARADVWPIYQLTDQSLNLTPSYQRGDVWRNTDRQALIESVLRGIPLPSVILLKTGSNTPHEVVDGKQRLTAILRFIGKHPTAIEKVEEANRLHPEVGFTKLFESDYPKFRSAWKRYMGMALNAQLEDEFYFPFKLRSGEKNGLVGRELEPLRGKYFTQIKEKVITVADEEVTIKRLFENVVGYKVPVIEYTKASQRQIHEVFKLYNKQGMHLNAEEIRNAVYHDIQLTRAMLFAAGDANPRSNVEDVAPALKDISEIEELGRNLSDYGFGQARYRRTKVLGWIISALIRDTHGKLLPSTARNTDLMLSEVQEHENHPLREEKRLADLFSLLTTAIDIHASHDELWPDGFRGDRKSSKWQDLPLVASIIGIILAVAGNPEGVRDQIQNSAEAIRMAALEEWGRPKKTQTRTQWSYIAKCASGIAQMLGVSIDQASVAIRQRFGSSGIDSLLLEIQSDKNK
ncbi:DUF262 domain-containing protein [Glutamicibacter mishrai]|uniref:DUF262 domain-containing protein n=1 Tax=Glutamicibacter mishrai TaxID=1775880 RepID=UPI003F78B2C5